MPKGKNKKPDHLKTNERPARDVDTTDTLSPVDIGADFVKQGETARGYKQ